MSVHSITNHLISNLPWYTGFIGWFGTGTITFLNAPKRTNDSNFAVIFAFNILVSLGASTIGAGVGVVLGRSWRSYLL